MHIKNIASKQSVRFSLLHPYRHWLLRHRLWIHTFDNQFINNSKSYVILKLNNFYSNCFHLFRVNILRSIFRYWFFCKMNVTDQNELDKSLYPIFKWKIALKYLLNIFVNNTNRGLFYLCQNTHQFCAIFGTKNNGIKIECREKSSALLLVHFVSNFSL